MRQLAAYVGWDWADKDHELCLKEAGSGRLERETLEGQPEGIHQWASRMRKRFGGRAVGVCIETSRGPVIAALMKYDHIVIYPVNPKSVSGYREVLHPSGKKDDRTDAEIACEFLANHWERLRVLEPTDRDTRLMGMLSEQIKKMQKELDRELNRLRSNLKQYYPQALDLIGNLGTPMAMKFLLKWPALEPLKRARLGTIEKFYRNHGSRREEVIQTRLEVIERAVPLTDDEAMLRAGVICTETIAKVVLEIMGSLDRLKREIASLYEQHEEFELIHSLPGAGPVLGPRLISILGTDRGRFEEADELQMLTGIAPVTVQTGGPNGTRSVRRRIKRSKFIHQTILEWADQFYRRSEWGRIYYDRQREKGIGHWSAVRKLGFKLIRILFRCWKNRQKYDETHHQNELIRRGSPLAEHLVASKA